ncbi:hypothetical protein CAPTEDRAFT_209570 [Capitella teleta]|uniref:Uncharacterized protein n=1 Tax=Capitella teleta TaxID=283909 RepID=R7VI85_CAPTE|nr:hypothetical protein CAPTEDRAFT_209570 [Capitella teleta]|eukprot:ELU18558.1 hypothetical protein CAPTEDRAFT_209570 [Capitella teleta]
MGADQRWKDYRDEVQKKVSKCLEEFPELSEEQGRVVLRKKLCREKVKEGWVGSLEEVVESDQAKQFPNPGKNGKNTEVYLTRAKLQQTDSADRPIRQVCNAIPMRRLSSNRPTTDAVEKLIDLVQPVEALYDKAKKNHRNNTFLINARKAFAHKHGNYDGRLGEIELLFNATEDWIAREEHHRYRMNESLRSHAEKLNSRASLADVDA